jgi:hypothetical protein
MKQSFHRIIFSVYLFDEKYQIRSCGAESFSGVDQLVKFARVSEPLLNKEGTERRGLSHLFNTGTPESTR